MSAQNTPETGTEYDVQRIEAAWPQFWDEQQVYKPLDDGSKPRRYVLDMFPYPPVTCTWVTRRPSPWATWWPVTGSTAAMT